MTTDNLSKQTQITIVAALDSSSNKVQLFLANPCAALDASDQVTDTFSGSTEALSVTVTVLSANGEVDVKNTSDSSGSWSWTPSQGKAGGAPIYYSSATCNMLSTVVQVKDTFTIKVKGVLADPTVVITRGGPSNNVVVGSRPKQG